MKVNDVTKWIRLDYEATSLYDVLANGIHRKTTAGHNVWKSLIAGSSLQIYCNREGLNNAKNDFWETTGITNGPIHVRVGIIANNQNDCESCNSWLGFGAEHYKTNITVGNFALVDAQADNGAKNTSAIGYILVA